MTAKTIVFEHEELTADLVIELLPMLKKHWVEIAHYPDIQFNPNWDAYFQLQKNNLLVVMTARDDNKLIGYIAYFVMPNLHYKDSLQANQDVVFVDPLYRRGTLGYKLIRQSEILLKDMGVQVVTQHLKFEHDFSPLLKRLGYEDVDKLMAKRLD